MNAELKNSVYFICWKDRAKPPARRGCSAYASESDTTNLQSSIFNSGLSGLGLDLPTMAENKLYVKSIMSTIYGVF